MPRTKATATRVATAIAVCLLAALALAACGGSSKSSSTGTAAQTQAATTPGAATGTSTTGTTGTTPSLTPAAIAYRKCLQAHGAGLPKLVPGKNGLPPTVAGHLELPKGVSKAAYEAAVRACNKATEGATSNVGAALQKFAACMRAHGAPVPAPDKSKGALAYLTQFTAPKYQPALKKCTSVLSSALPAKSG